MWRDRIGNFDRPPPFDHVFRPSLFPPPPPPFPGDGSTDHLDGAPALHAPAPTLPAPGAPAVDVGREPPADVVLPLPTVSARHATLAVAAAGDAALVTDCGSTNGSYVDGEPLEAGVEAVVARGSVVVFGDQYLAAFRLEDA